MAIQYAIVQEEIDRVEGMFKDELAKLKGAGVRTQIRFIRLKRAPA
jgi:hypothetical protein